MKEADFAQWVLARLEQSLAEPVLGRDSNVRAYLASRFTRRSELADYAVRLEAQGYATITSRWLNQPDDWNELDPEAAAMCAQQDLEDVASANVVVVFTSPEGSSRGGHHVEFGFALGLNKKIVLIGERQSVFHWLPEVKQFVDFEDFIYAIEVEKGLARVLGAA